MANNERMLEPCMEPVCTFETLNDSADATTWLWEHVGGQRILYVGDAAAPRADGLVADVRAAGVRAAEFSPESFDAVVLSDALERQEAPGKLLARVAGWLSEGGCLAVSISPGYRSGADQQHARGPLGWLDLLGGQFSVRRVAALESGYLCVLAAKPAAGCGPELLAPDALCDWLRQCEPLLQAAQCHSLDAAQETVRQLQQASQMDQATLVSVRQSLATEESLRRKLQQRASTLNEQLSHTKATLELRENEVRYRLGDAIVSALRPSKATLLLPVRLARLFGDGIGRALARRREAKRRRIAATPPGERRGRAPAWSLVGNVPKPEFEGAALLPAYARAPEEQIARKTLRIAGVMDEFSWRAWQYEADLYSFTPTDWQQALEERPPEVLLVESTWSGIKDAWHLQLRDLGQCNSFVKRYAMPDVVKWAREREIPTVFYNKEDPPNFDVFIDAAKLFDFVFTSDANCIEDYRKHLRHDRIYALPFAAQPRIHHPMRVEGARSENVCFAGTWYAHRHFNRQEEADKILSAGLEHGLHIYDRMAHAENENYRWPEEYQPALRGALSYAQMLVAYKRYKVFLNINSVADSPTMFSRRVFELLACGTPVISAYALGIEQMLGADIVSMSEDGETTRAMLARLLEDDEYRERLALRGQRKVFTEHTYAHRLDMLLRTIGLDGHTVQRPKIAVVALVGQPADVAAAVESFRRQEYGRKELILCATRVDLMGELDRQRGPLSRSVRIVAQEGAAWPKLLAAALQDCQADFIVPMNSQDYYGAHYLTDYAHASLYADAPAIGKATHYTCAPGGSPEVAKPGREYGPADGLWPWTLCVPRARMTQLLHELPQDAGAAVWWERAADTLGRAYSSDRFNYVSGGDSGAERLQAALT